MTSDSFNMNKNLERWFEHGDEEAHGILYTNLRQILNITQEVTRALGDDIARDVQQELLLRLLDRDAKRLYDKREPLAYVRGAWRSAVRNVVSDRLSRLTKVDLIRQHVSQALDRDDYAQIDSRFDSERALSIAAELESTGRLAVLLTTRPDRITDADWGELRARHPPPPPPRPSDALDRRGASALMYPPNAGESEERYKKRSLNSFNQAYGRAIEHIRSRMEVAL
jgi:hypothetical protein